MILTAWGLFRMDIGSWEKGYMVATWLYLMSSAFTLQKAIRDRHEADLLEGGTSESGSSGSAPATPDA
jgi:hypothetical protein